MIFCFIAGGLAFFLGLFFLIRTYKTGDTESKASMVCFGLCALFILEGIGIVYYSKFLMCIAPIISIFAGPILQIIILAITSFLVSAISNIQEKNYKGLLSLLITLAIIVAIIFFVVSMVQDCGSNSTEHFDQSHMEVIAKDAVKENLKAPSTASFSNISVSKNGNTWTVTGYVDAQNSFGAMIRSSFKVVIEDNGYPMYSIKSVIIN